MKKHIFMLLTLLTFIVAGCGNNATVNELKNSSANAKQTSASTETIADTMDEGDISMKNTKLKITVGNKEMIATLEDNATTRALLKKLPMTLSMKNLYSREMCYRYGAGSLPTENLRSDRYEVGDIVYWPPRGSFVILYAQNGECFERQQIGHITDGVELFNQFGDAEVKFEAVKN